MAAYMRSVIILLSTERNALLRRGCDYTVESRRYVRGLRRTPVKVLFPDSNRETVAPPQGSQGRKEPKPAPPKAAGMKRTFSPPAAIMIPSHASVPASEQSNVTFSKDRIGGLRFETAFPGDKRLARVVSIARSRTFREHQGKILLEGKRLICDALEAGAHPQMVFFSRVEKLCELPLDKLKRATLVKVKFEEIKIWSELVAPQGVMAIFSRPHPEKMSFPEARPTVPLSLICDNIRDPGNMGTILRSAAAAGCRDVLLTKGCVDPWEPKVLRAAMGAHFRLPVHCSLDWKDIRARLPEHTSVHVADNYCGPASAGEEEVTEPHRAEVRGQPTGALKAGDYGWVSTRRGRGNPDRDEYDSDSDSDSDDEGLQLPRVDALLYHEGWGRGPAALVVGGETHGLSLESVELAGETGGRRLRIPMVPGVDSLNSAMAASILLFEGRRQMSDSTETSARKGKAERRLI